MENKSDKPTAADNQQGRLGIENGKSELLSNIEAFFNEEYAFWRTRFNVLRTYPAVKVEASESEIRMKQTARLLRIVGEIAGVELTLEDKTST